MAKGPRRADGELVDASAPTGTARDAVPLRSPTANGSPVKKRVATPPERAAEKLVGAAYGERCGVPEAQIIARRKPAPTPVTDVKPQSSVTAA